MNKVLNEVDILYKSSFIHPDLLAPPLHPNGPSTIKLFRKLSLGKINIGGTTTPDAPTAYKIMTSSPHSALVTDPMRFFPVGATTPSGYCAVVQPVSSNL